MIPATEKRSNEQILTQAPIEVALGDATYQIKPLRILKSRDWRQLLLNKMAEIAGKLKVDMGSDAALLSGLGYVMLQFPEILTELIFEYAPNIPRDKVLDPETGATEEQVAIAFGKIMQVAFPFTGELKTVLVTMGASATSLS